MKEQKTPSDIVLLRTADGESRLCSSQGLDLSEYTFLKSTEVRPGKLIDEWVHDSVAPQWFQTLINEMFDDAVAFTTVDQRGEHTSPIDQVAWPKVDDEEKTEGKND